jgi:hypothetical protein
LPIIIPTVLHTDLSLGSGKTVSVKATTLGNLVPPHLKLAKKHPQSPTDYIT